MQLRELRELRAREKQQQADSLVALEALGHTGVAAAVLLRNFHWILTKSKQNAEDYLRRAGPVPTSMVALVEGIETLAWALSQRRAQAQALIARPGEPIAWTDAIKSISKAIVWIKDIAKGIPLEYCKDV